jgi:hypothetical protein
MQGRPPVIFTRCGVPLFPFCGVHIMMRDAKPLLSIVHNAAEEMITVICVMF